MGAISDTTEPQAATPEEAGPSAFDTPESETTPIQLTTTEEAKSWARRALQDYYGHTRTGEDAIAAEATAAANKAKAALRAAQQRLMQDPYAPSPAELAQRQGAALMDPGKTGRPTEGLRSYITELANQSQAERERQALLASTGVGYERDIQGINDKLLALRQRLTSDQEKYSSGLAKQGIQTLGRMSTGAAGAKPLSKEGKQALDEGLAMGSPEWNARVHDLINAAVEDAHARAGTDAQELSPQERTLIADNAGVPAHIASPFEGMSTREKLQQKRLEQNKAAAEFQKFADQDRQISDMTAQIHHFLDVNRHTHTGPELAGIGLPGLSAGPHGASVHGGEGWNINIPGFIAKFNPNIQELDKITQNLVTTMQKPGFSRVTNFDLQTFQKGMMGIDKPFEVNQNIAAPLLAFGDDARQYHLFKQQYNQVHGTTQGTEAAWDDYLNHMPIFDPSKPGSYALNPNRMSWQDYFRAKNRGVDFKSVEIPKSWQVGGVGDIYGGQKKAGPHASGIIERKPIAPTTDQAAALANPGMIPGTDQGAPPPRAPAWQPADEEPAVEAHAEGGEVGDDQELMPGQIESALQALRAGMTFKASQGREDKSSPATNFLGETAGGAGTVAALLALARLRGRLGRGAAAVGRYAAENPNKAAMLAGAGAGAASGAIGASPGEGVSQGLAYGLTGIPLGLTARLGASGASRKLQALTERMRGMPPIGAGDRRTIAAINADLGKAGGANWQDLTDMIRDDRRLKVPSTLGDLPDMNSTRGLAKAALSKDTGSGRQYADQLNQRQEQAGSRVGDRVNQALAPDPYLQQSETLRDALYRNSAPLYQAAYQAFPAIRSQALFDLMNTPAGGEAAQRALTKMQNKQRPIGAMNSVTGMVERPSLEYLDNVKRSLDDMILREEGSGANYQATDDGSILRQMREKLRNELDAATALPNGQPGPYQQARQQYAGDLEVLDALRSGREDFKALTPEALQQKMQQMSFAERDAFRSGVAEFFFRQLGGATEGVNPAKRLISTPDIADKIGAIFENPRDATRFISGLQRESEMFDTAKPVMTAAKQGQERAVTPESITSLARSKMMTKQTASDINANMATTSTDPHALDKINRLRDAADRLRSRDTIANKVGVAVGAGAAGAASPSGINNPPVVGEEP